MLEKPLKQIENNTYAVTVKHISSKQIANIEIPLPPLEVQEQIVAEISGYQKIIDGARQVVDNYKPHICIDPSWPIYRMSEIAWINRESRDPKDLYKDTFTYIDISSVENETGIIDFSNVLRVEEAPSRARRIVREKDILLSTVRPNLRAFAYLDILPSNPIVSTGLAVITTKEGNNPKFIYWLLFSDYVLTQMTNKMGKGSYPSINQSDVSDIRVPLPSLETQNLTASQIDKEQQLISANKRLIEIFEQKMKERIAQVWGEK
jgi:type I restriction enzyme M protein